MKCGAEEKDSFAAKILEVPPVQRLALVVKNIVEKNKAPGKCAGCWLMTVNCVCHRWTRVESETKVVVHIHHNCRGVSSNTALCIHRTLSNSEFFLRGLPEDDEKMNALWNNSDYTPCVLWPGDGALSVAELKASIDPKSKLVLVVPDGTFSGARRMMKKYPGHCIKVCLSSKSVLGDKVNSFLYPVRKYGGSECETGRVSTLEAVAAFLREMEEADCVSSSLINNMKIQMDMALRQKCRPMIYNTLKIPTTKE